MKLKTFRLILFIALPLSISINLLYLFLIVFYISNNKEVDLGDIIISLICVVLMIVFNIVQLINSINSRRNNISFLRTVLYGEENVLNKKIAIFSLVFSVILFITFIFVELVIIVPNMNVFPFNNLQYYVISSFLMTFMVDFLLIYLFSRIKIDDINKLESK